LLTPLLAIKPDNVFFERPSQAEFLKPVLDSEPAPTTVKVGKYTTIQSQPLIHDCKWNDKMKAVADWSICLDNFGHCKKEPSNVRQFV